MSADAWRSAQRERAANLCNFREESGWTGCFLRTSAPGAIPSGARIIKAARVAGDGHPVGTPGTVLGSFASPPGLAPVGGRAIRFFYFVEWDDAPRVACGLVDWKIARSN